MNRFGQPPQGYPETSFGEDEEEKCWRYDLNISLNAFYMKHLGRNVSSKAGGTEDDIKYISNMAFRIQLTRRYEVVKFYSKDWIPKYTCNEEDAVGFFTGGGKGMPNFPKLCPVDEKCINNTTASGRYYCCNRKSTEPLKDFFDEPRCPGCAPGKEIPCKANFPNICRASASLNCNKQWYRCGIDPIEEILPITMIPSHCGDSGMGGDQKSKCWSGDMRYDTPIGDTEMGATAVYKLLKSLSKLNALQGDTSAPPGRVGGAEVGDCEVCDFLCCIGNGLMDGSNGGPGCTEEDCKKPNSGLAFEGSVCWHNCQMKYQDWMANDPCTSIDPSSWKFSCCCGRDK